jgi:hypothetical protein
MSSTLEIREELIRIAYKDVGQVEYPSHNQGEWIEKFWPATSYPEGYENAEPYCAAACCYWVREWVEMSVVQKAFGMDAASLEDWRCKSAAVFEWEDWAHEWELPVLNRDAVLHTGDMMIFDCSHIGIVWTDRGANILTIEANTGPMGEREGDGCYLKIRTRDVAKSFIRMLA